jgi:hypothetical protein
MDLRCRRLGFRVSLVLTEVGLEDEIGVHRDSQSLRRQESHGHVGVRRQIRKSDDAFVLACLSHMVIHLTS